VSEVNLESADAVLGAKKVTSVESRMGSRSGRAAALR
jgi:hypothetical protein